MAICKSCGEPTYDGDYCEACSQKDKIENQEDYDFSDSEDELEKLFSVLSEKEMMTEESLNELFLDEPYFNNDFFNDLSQEKIDRETSMLKSNGYSQVEDDFISSDGEVLSSTKKEEEKKHKRNPKSFLKGLKKIFKKKDHKEKTSINKKQKDEELDSSKEKVLVYSSKTIITLSILTFLVTIIIFIGINIGTYLFSLNEADNHYNNKRYGYAYEKIDGMFLYREKDRVLYEKLKIIMTIQHYLDLYSSYNNLGMYPENKNSLIVGLSKFEDIKEDASEIGVLNEIEYLMEIISNELENLTTKNE